MTRGFKLNLGIITVIFSLIMAMFLLAKVAAADTWSWTSGAPVIESKNDAALDESWRDSCQSKFHSVKDDQVVVDGTENTVAPMTDCVIASGQNFTLYSYRNTYSIAIKFAGDTKAHMIRGVDCTRACAYMPSRDIFVSIESHNGASSGRVNIYRNFVKKLELRNVISLNQKFYDLPQTEPDDTISDFYGSEKYAGYTKHIQRSSNDKWLVVEFVGIGLFRYDMDSGQMLKFSSWRTDYWYAGPQIEYDITDDGRHVAVVGQNSINEIYDITDNCGLAIPAIYNDSTLAQNQPTPCPSLQLGSTDTTPAEQIYMPRMRDAYQPQFSDDGGEISFYATSYDTSLAPRFISLKAAGYVVQRLDYLALGDSYSSGEGDTEKDSSGNKYYRSLTDTSSERCHLSTRSYPYKLAAGMNLTINSQWNSVACSGATAWDVKEQGSLGYLGQNDRLKGLNVDQLKTQALNEFIPGRQKQIEFVKKYHPKVITLTMGGNDVGFGDKIKKCASNFDTCEVVNEGKGELKNDTLNQFDNLRSLYEELYKASGSQAKIYVLGYPSFINDDENALCYVNVGLLNNDERKLIQNSVSFFNSVIKQAASAAGVKYIDIEGSLNGHRLCDGGKKQVTGITDLSNINGNRQESFHPNAAGHLAIATSVLQDPILGYKNLLDYDICPITNVNSCPDISATKESIVIPDYFQGSDSKVNSQQKEMTGFEQKINTAVDIAAGLYTFAKNTSVTIIVHSDPVNLGQYAVGEDGSFTASVILPVSLPVGMHTLHVLGTTYSNDPIEYTQSILVKGPNSNDVDADGIVDTQDKCLFLPVSGKDMDKDGIDDACDPEISDPPVVPSPTPSQSSSPSPSPTSTPIPKPQGPIAVLGVVIKKVVKTVVAIVNTVISFLQKLLLR